MSTRTRRSLKAAAVAAGMLAVALLASMLAIVAVGSPASAADEPDAPDEPVRHHQPLPDAESCGSDAATGHAAPMASLRELKHCARHVSHLASTDVGRSWRVWAKRWRGACRAIPGFEPAGFEAPSYAPAMPAPRHAARWAAKLPDGRGKRTTGTELDAMKRFCVVRRLTPPGPPRAAVDEVVRITAALDETGRLFAIGDEPSISSDPGDMWAGAGNPIAPGGTPYGGRFVVSSAGSIHGPSDGRVYVTLEADCLKVAADGWSAVFTHVATSHVVTSGGSLVDSIVIASATCHLEPGDGGPRTVDPMKPAA